MSLKVDVKFELPSEEIEKPLTGNDKLLNWTHHSVNSFPSTFGEGHFWISTKENHKSITYTIYFVAQRHFHRINSFSHSKQPYVDLTKNLKAKLSTNPSKGSFIKCQLNGKGKIYSFISPASLWPTSSPEEQEELALLLKMEQELKEWKDLDAELEKGVEKTTDGIGWGTVTLVMLVSTAAGIYLSYRFPLEQVKEWRATKFLLKAKERAWPQIATLTSQTGRNPHAYHLSRRF